MIARLFLSLLIPAIPLVAGLQKIHPNLRQLQFDEAAFVAAKHNMGVDAVMNGVDSGASVPEMLDVLFEAMEEDDEIPDFDRGLMTTFATAIFVDESGPVDFIQALMDQSEALSGTSPVMGAVYEVMSDLDNVGTVEECTDKVTAAAEKSGLDSEMKLASVSDAVAVGSGQYWNDAKGVRRKLQLIPLIAVIIADIIGAIIGFALGGILTAIVLGVLASVLAAIQLGLIC